MKVLIIDGHPYHKGLASELSRSYAEGAKKGGHEVRLVKIRDLEFDPILRYGYRKRMELEPDLIEQQENLKWCDHLVVTTPIWWMSLPALLKGFFDRILLPKFAFSYSGRKFIPKGLLSGRSARVIYTQGSSRWITGIILFDIHWLLIKLGIFKFVGFSSVKRFAIGGAEKLTEKKKAGIVEKVSNLGKRAK